MQQATFHPILTSLMNISYAMSSFKFIKVNLLELTVKRNEKSMQEKKSIENFLINNCSTLNT